MTLIRMTYGKQLLFVHNVAVKSHKNNIDCGTNALTIFHRFKIHPQRENRWKKREREKSIQWKTAILYVRRFTSIYVVIYIICKWVYKHIYERIKKREIKNFWQRFNFQQLKTPFFLLNHDRRCRCSTLSKCLQKKSFPYNNNCVLNSIITKSKFQRRTVQSRAASVSVISMLQSHKLWTMKKRVIMM